jgi:hypothetical protein
MQLEIVREIVDALNDVTTGVSAQLATLPKDVGDTFTASMLVVDGTKDDDLIKGEQISSGEAEVMLLVTPDGATVTNSKGVKAEYSYGSTPIAITVVHRGNGMPSKKFQDVEYVLRSTVLSVKAYFALRQEHRERNQVKLLLVQNLSYGLVEDDGIGALGAVVFYVDALDMRAQRTV